MCTVVMPADYEMLVEHSPPVAADFFSNYTSYRLRYDTPVRTYSRPPQYNPYPFSQPTPRPTTLTTQSSQTQTPSVKMPVALPRRPCLIVRPEEASSSSDENDLPSPTRLKKKVVFADDKGLSLTQVRVMTEPSNVPPVFSFQFLSQVTRGISAEVAPEPWEVTFPQPASDYLDFRNRLDTANVSLENVIVRESEDIVIGTVKVRNLFYHKEVFVRSTSDDWKTHEDAFCTFVKNNSTPALSGAYVLYDTFSFRLTLPPRSRRIEFCVCFRCEGAEYWDSNSGKNYVLLKRSSSSAEVGIHEEESLLNKLRRSNSDTSPIENAIKCSDAVHAKLDSWSEFASWNHLDNSTPYW